MPFSHARLIEIEFIFVICDVAPYLHLPCDTCWRLLSWGRAGLGAAFVYSTNQHPDQTCRSLSAVTLNVYLRQTLEISTHVCVCVYEDKLCYYHCCITWRPNTVLKYFSTLYVVFVRVLFIVLCYCWYEVPFLSLATWLMSHHVNKRELLLLLLLLLLLSS